MNGRVRIDENSRPGRSHGPLAFEPLETLIVWNTLSTSIK